MSEKKGLGQLILGNVVKYKKVYRLQSGEYFQVHQEDETRNTIAINRTVSAIALGPQYNLQGGYFFDILLTGKRLWRSPWTPVNMTDYFIERYATFNTKGCPEDLIFLNFNDQPIPSTYYDITNDYDDEGTQINAVLTDN